MNIGYLFGGENATYQLQLLFNSPFNDSGCKTLSWRFIHSIYQLTSYQTHPIYALLYESIYCHNQASNWVSDQVMSSIEQFNENTTTPYFYAENINQTLFMNDALLKPWAKTAEQLAQKHWGSLYNMEALKHNEIPIIACVYKNDFYVDYQFSLQTVQMINNCFIWKNQKDVHGALHLKKDRIIKNLHHRFLAIDQKSSKYS